MRRINLARAALCALVLAAGSAAARLTEINIAAIEPFADGMAFGDAGAERDASGDPRRSLEERYGDHAGYVRRVEEAVTKLVADGCCSPRTASASLRRRRARKPRSGSPANGARRQR